MSNFTERQTIFSENYSQIRQLSCTWTRSQWSGNCQSIPGHVNGVCLLHVAERRWKERMAGAGHTTLWSSVMPEMSSGTHKVIPGELPGEWPWRASAGTGSCGHTWRPSSARGLGLAPSKTPVIMGFHHNFPWTNSPLFGGFNFLSNFS